ncbi:MFS transporter [Sphingobium sp. CR28]|uniref:MFS transporter n=1 Tax=Sphingobium sp. CR28 TaxID=3400272 RepID=UPI003FEF5FFC
MIVLTAMGGALEFYDFIVYGIFAQLIAAAIFPPDYGFNALSLSFAIFAIGYLARPLGGMVSSHFGDRYGRKTVFIVTIFIMSVSTFAIGLVPTYASWGWAASLTLLFLRFVQGLCIGGELPGAITYVFETAERRPGLACGIVIALVNGGVLLAASVNLILETWLPPAVMHDYGWRIAFIIGGMMGLLSFWLRRSIEETREFLLMRSRASSWPVREVLATHQGAILLGCGVTLLTAGFNGLFFAHMPAYLVQVLGYDRHPVALAMNVALFFMSLSLLGASWWADRVSPWWLLMASSILLLFGGPAAYIMLATGHANLMIVLSLLALIVSGANGSFALLLARLFPARIRFSGVALSLNISFTLLSGLGPLIANGLIGATGWNAAPGLIIAAVALVGFFASITLCKRERGCVGKLQS